MTFLRSAILFSFFVTSAQAVMLVNLANFDLRPDTLEGNVIVDQDGVALSQERLSIQVGTFDPTFASKLGSLHPLSDVSAVRSAFIAGTLPDDFSYPLDGLFNNSFEFNIDAHALINPGDAIYTLINYDPEFGESVSLVFGFGDIFPETDGLGNAVWDMGRAINAGDIAYGGGVYPGVVDTTDLPPLFRVPEFNQGIVIGVPEPSVSLLTLSAVLLLFRRHRL